MYCGTAPYAYTIAARILLLILFLCMWLSPCVAVRTPQMTTGLKRFLRHRYGAGSFQHELGANEFDFCQKGGICLSSEVGWKQLKGFKRLSSTQPLDAALWPEDWPNPPRRHQLMGQNVLPDFYRELLRRIAMVLERDIRDYCLDKGIDLGVDVFTCVFNWSSLTGQIVTNICLPFDKKEVKRKLKHYDGLRKDYHWCSFHGPYLQVQLGPRKTNNGKTVSEYVHRIICFAFHGAPTRKRYMVCHSCNNKSCLNPSHMYWGDHEDNASDWKRAQS